MEPADGAPSTPRAPHVEDFTAVIEAAVARSIAAFQATQPQSPQPTRSSKRRNQVPKEGSTAHSRKVKREAYDALDKDSENEWKVRCLLTSFVTTDLYTLEFFMEMFLLCNQPGKDQ